MLNGDELERHRTAIHRTRISRPIQSAIDDGLITEGTDVFDYGCGRGDDVRLLIQRGIPAVGWDPAHFPAEQRIPSEVVNLGFVVNVIEDEAERAQVLCEAWSLSRRLLIVAARLTREARLCLADDYADGVLTRRNTFQKFYEHDELRAWVEMVLGIECTAAAPGIFYVFRDDEARERFRSARFRRTTPTPLPSRWITAFREHEEHLRPLMDFIVLRGRLPYADEEEVFAELSCRFGSIKRAFRTILKATGVDYWDRIVAERRQDLTVYLALNRFGGRPPRKALPREMSYDVRAFFGTYKTACQAGDDLLFSLSDRATLDTALGSAPVGKLTQSALYVHADALSVLPPMLRVYEGCARVLVGSVPEANIIKLHRLKPEISYLSYPTFESDAHPALAGSLLVNLQWRRIAYRDYTESDNPPILHRKEQFINTDDPRHGLYSALTAAEIQAGLYDGDTSLIGNKRGWEAILTEKGVIIGGHEVLK